MIGENPKFVKWTSTQKVINLFFLKHCIISEISNVHKAKKQNFQICEELKTFCVMLSAKIGHVVI